MKRFFLVAVLPFLSAFQEAIMGVFNEFNCLLRSSRQQIQRSHSYCHTVFYLM